MVYGRRRPKRERRKGREEANRWARSIREREVKEKGWQLGSCGKTVGRPGRETGKKRKKNEKWAGIKRKQNGPKEI